MASSHPEKIGDYVVDRLLGYGSFGIVYHGVNPNLNRKTAIKIPRLQWQKNKAMLERFNQEAKLSASLTHPNIIPVFEAKMDEEFGFFIASEYSPGKNLKDWSLSGGTPKYNGEQMLNVCCQIASAVSCAHEHNIVHRDLRPKNILVEDNGENEGEPRFVPRVTDFGLAISLTEINNDDSSVISGSIHYLSPEQMNYDLVSKSSDVFSLGVVFYELFTGINPFFDECFKSSMERKITFRPEKPSELTSMPENIDYVIMKCLEKEPEDRYPSATELCRDLTLILKGEPIEKNIVSLLRRMENWSKNENRLIEAQQIVFFINAGILIWSIGSLFVGLSSENVSVTESFQMFGVSTFIAMIYHIPLLWLSGHLKNIKAKWILCWFFYAVFVSAFAGLGASGLIPTPFSMYQENPPLRIMVLGMIFIFNSFQTAWLLFAYQTRRKLDRFKLVIY